LFDVDQVNDCRRALQYCRYKVGWLVVELKLLDRPMRHEPAEVRCAEVASCVHGGGGEWLEIGGIAEDKLTFLSVATKNMVAVSVPFKRTS